MKKQKVTSGGTSPERDISFLDKVFSSAGEGIIVSNSQGEIYLANERAAAMFGYDREEMHHMTIEDLVPQAVRSRHSAHRQSYLQDPQPRPMGIGYDLSGQRKDGSVFPLEISLSYVNHDKEGWVVAFVIDITQRKAQEQEILENRQKLEEYANKLELKVQERTQEIEHMNLGLRSQIRERKLAEDALKASLDDLQDARAEAIKALEKERELNELKSRFISMASHEFRTPLTTISSSANLIERYPETEQQDKRLRHVERIRNSVRNLTNILNDFLSLEKLESGKIQVRFSTVALCGLLEELEEDFNLNLKDGQRLEIDREQDSVELRTDPHLLKNILINLISNAVKYSPEQAVITVRYRCEEDGRHRIDVIDRGMGIPQNEQKNLFQRFFRARNVANLQGTGLGLNIVKRYVGILGGDITFVSEEGNGTTFTLYLPTQPPENANYEEDDTDH